MSTLVSELRASYAFVERNTNLIKRYWSWELVWMVYAIVNSLSVSYIGLGMERIGGENVNGRYLVLYLVIGTLVWRYLSLIFYWITDVIGMERWEGTIEYTLMAPIRRFTHMAGQTIFSIVYSMFSTSIVLLVVALMFNLDLSKANLLGGALVLLAGSFSFTGVGIVASILPMLFPERGTQMTHVIIAMLLLISGVYYPIDVLPGIFPKMALLSPATYVLDGSRKALLDGASIPELWPYIWPVLIMGFIAIPAGLKIFALAERYAKRTGKLHRNG